MYIIHVLEKERISRLFQMHSNKQNPKEFIGTGDIGAGWF